MCTCIHEKGIDKQGRNGWNNCESLSNDIQCDECMLISKVNKPPSLRVTHYQTMRKQQQLVDIKLYSFRRKSLCYLLWLTLTHTVFRVFVRWSAKIMRFTLSSDYKPFGSLNIQQTVIIDWVTTLTNLFTIKSTVWCCIHTLRSRLMHWATSQKVAGSTPDGVTRIFRRLNPTGRTLVLGSTQPLTKMITRGNSWEGGKGGQCVGLTALLTSYADCSEIL